MRTSCFISCQRYLNPKSPAKNAKIAKMSTLRLNIFKTAAPIHISFCLHSYICLSYLNPRFQAKIPIFKKWHFFSNKPYQNAGFQSKTLTSAFGYSILQLNRCYSSRKTWAVVAKISHLCCSLYCVFFSNF